MGRISRIVIVCEGYRDSAFARGFFAEAKLERAINLRENPAGEGSGHDFVRMQFVKEAKNLLKAREGHGVLGLLDEDGQGASRIDAINHDLKKLGIGGIDCNSGRCLLLPTRNIETWTYWLRGFHSDRACEVSETANYKNEPPGGESRIHARDFSIAGKALHRLNHTSLPVGCPPALGRALTELRAFVRAIERA